MPLFYSPGWVDMGATVQLETATDTVTIGSAVISDGSSGFLKSAGGFIANNAGLGYRTVGGEFLITASGNNLFIDTGAAGSVNLRPAGGTVRLKVDTTGVGFNAQAPIARPTYTVTNPTTDRALNVTADTLAQGLAVLGTLIADLQTYGLLQ